MKKEIYKEKLELKEVPVENDVPFSKINCPSCNEQVTSDNLDLAKAVAKCGSCHVVFPIEETLALVSKSQTKSEKQMLLPKGVDVFEFKKHLEISINNPYTWLDILLFLFILFVPLISLKFLANSIESGAFSTILFVIGLCLNLVPLYWVFFLRKKNKVIFSVNQETLDIEWRPRFLRKDRSFNRDSIEQVYIKPGYGVYIIVNDFGELRHIPIFRYQDPSKMVHLEKTLEKLLGIEEKKYHLP